MWNKATTKQFALTHWENDTWYARTIFVAVYQAWVWFERLLVPLRKRALDLSVLAFVAVIGAYVFLPTVVNADAEQNTGFDQDTIARMVATMQNETVAYGHLPQSADVPPRKTFSIPVTAYTSEVGQTDSTPCITASGLDVCERNEENVVAANFLPIGTRLRMPELFGDRVFYVEDRMNARYVYKADIWMKNKSDAIAFGLKHTTIEVF